MKKKFRKITLDFIRRSISFDGTADEKCPHCKKVTSWGYSWIYHKWTLAWDIAKYMGFGEAIQKQIEEELQNDYWNFISHNGKFPYKKLAEKINSLILGEEDNGV